MKRIGIEGVYEDGQDHLTERVVVAGVFSTGSPAERGSVLRHVVLACTPAAAKHWRPAPAPMLWLADVRLGVVCHRLLAAEDNVSYAGNEVLLPARGEWEVVGVYGDARRAATVARQRPATVVPMTA